MRLSSYICKILQGLHFRKRIEKDFYYRMNTLALPETESYLNERLGPLGLTWRARQSAIDSTGYMRQFYCFIQSAPVSSPKILPILHRANWLIRARVYRIISKNPNQTHRLLVVCLNKSGVLEMLEDNVWKKYTVERAIKQANSITNTFLLTEEQ